MLLTLIISSLVKDLSLQKMWSLLIVTLLIKPLMAIISLSKPKVKHTKKIDGPEKVSSGRGRTRPGDHTTFNAYIEFTIIVDDEKNTKVARYFPRSGVIQIFSANAPIDILINYLLESDLPEFASVSLVGEMKPLLMNYRFSINIVIRSLLI